MPCANCNPDFDCIFRNMTLKALRKDLERDLGLKVDELKPYKQDIALYVDQVCIDTKRCTRTGITAMH